MLITVYLFPLLGLHDVHMIIKLDNFQEPRFCGNPFHVVGYVYDLTDGPEFPIPPWIVISSIHVGMNNQVPSGAT